MTRTIHVLPWTEDRASRLRWATALSAAHHFHVVPQDAAPPAAKLPDVIVTDQLPVIGVPQRWLAMMHRGEIGVIAIGCAGVADVLLPPDYSARELRLACQLLAQIIQLRARLARAHARQRRFRKMAYSDPLTGLANRRMWDQQLGPRITEAHEAGSDCCLILIDIDHFKRINDRYGHTVGDHLLQAVGQQLVANCRAQDLVARLGGDEFAILRSDIGGKQALSMVERIRAGIADARVEAADDARVTASAGYYVLTASAASDAGRALTVADRALLQAKTSGRDCAVAGDDT